MSSYSALMDQIARLTQQADGAREAERGAAIAEIRARMAECGVTIADLSDATGGKNGGATHRRVAAKYRNERTGDTWSGRGKQPRWLTAQLAAGKNLEDFLVR